MSNNQINQKRNISLIGFMGSGKTTVGKLLANEMSYSFIDMDNEIERLNNMSVSKIFDVCGEQYFRQQETDLISVLASYDRHVISTGGGIVKNKINIDILKTCSIVIFLRASFQHITANLKNDNSRPLLSDNDKEAQIKKLLLEREEIYEQCSDYIVDVSGKIPEIILKEVLLIKDKAHQLIFQ